MHPSLKLDNKKPDFHIFFIHSSLTLLVANTIIYKEKLDPKKVRFITQGEIYKYIDSKYSQQILELNKALPNIDRALGNPDTLIRISAQRLLYSTFAKFLNPNWENIFPKFNENSTALISDKENTEFTDLSDYLGNNLTFSLYTPHLYSMLFNGIASLPNCTEVNYLEEGMLNYITTSVEISCENDIEFFLNNPQLDPSVSGYRYITGYGHYPSTSISNPNISNTPKFFRISKKTLVDYIKEVKEGKFDPLKLVTYSRRDIYNANKYLKDLINPHTQKSVVKNYKELATEITEEVKDLPVKNIKKIAILCFDAWFTNDNSVRLANEDKPEDAANFDEDYYLKNEIANLKIFLTAFKEDLKQKKLDQYHVFVKFHPRTNQEGIDKLCKVLKEEEIKFIPYSGDFLELTLFNHRKGIFYIYSSHSTLSYIAHINPPHQGVMLYKALQQKNQHFSNSNKVFFDKLDNGILERTRIEKLKALFYKFLYN